MALLLDRLGQALSLFRADPFSTWRGVRPSFESWTRCAARLETPLLRVGRDVRVDVAWLSSAHCLFTLSVSSPSTIIQSLLNLILKHIMSLLGCADEILGEIILLATQAAGLNEAMKLRLICRKINPSSLKLLPNSR